MGEVDGDALFALGRQAIDEEGEIEGAALRADPLRIRFERRKLVLEQHLGLIEKPPDQSRLAVIDTAAGDEAQKVLVLLRAQIGFDIAALEFDEARHQRIISKSHRPSSRRKPGSIE